MATISKVKSDLDLMSTAINHSVERATQAKTMLQDEKTSLGNLATRFSDTIATINTFIPTGAFETLAKDEFSKLKSQFEALSLEIDSAITDLAAYTGF